MTALNLCGLMRLHIIDNLLLIIDDRQRTIGRHR